MTLLEIIYPISGEMRPVLLLLEWCFAFSCMEMGIMFCVKYFKIRQKRNVQDIGFSALCFGLSIAWYFQITADYYIQATDSLSFWIWNEVSLATFIWDVGFFAVIAGGFIFITLWERHQVFGRKYLFTTIYLICNAIFALFMAGGVYLGRLFAFIISFLILWFFFVFLLNLARKVRNRTEYKRVAVKFLVVVAVFGTGIFNAVDFGIRYATLETRLVGMCLLIGSFVYLCQILLRFPAISLLDWKKSVEELFLISKAGICLVQKSFGTRTRVLDDSITTSAITTVDMLLKEMIASGEQGLSKVKEKKKVIFILSSTLVNGAVISNEDNPAIPPKLKLLVQQFEEIYGDIVRHWDGNGSVFRPVETIIEEIFTD